MKISSLGFPRIGRLRELKFILERYWRGEAALTFFEKRACELKPLIGSGKQMQVLNYCHAGVTQSLAKDESMLWLQLEQVTQDTILRQLKLGIDVLVHSEAVRNDMVEYLGEQLQGVGFTQFGWLNVMILAALSHRWLLAMFLSKIYGGRLC